jgi:H+/Cl- antiporter ClcA
MSTAFAIKIIGLFLGVVARSLIPWLRKLRQGEVQTFDRRYLYSALATFLLGIILTLVLFPQFKSDALNTADFETYFRLFCLAFGFGFGWNAIVLEAGQWANWFLSE